MALPPQISVWDLWSESARLSESLGDPMFLECMEAADANKIFDDLVCYVKLCCILSNCTFKEYLTLLTLLALYYFLDRRMTN